MLLDQMSKVGLIPVVVLEDAKDASPVAKALIDGGINCAEVTFRTEAAEESIRNIVRDYPDMLVGAGTILNIEQADRAVKAGAKFIVTPGYNPEVVNYCVSEEIPIVPGCMDTNAIEMALSAGLDTVKFFPAQAAGGLAMLKALSGPYVNLKFMPTGGINGENLTEYLAFDKVIACGGSWMVKSSLIREGKFGEITKITKEAIRKMLGLEILYIDTKPEKEAKGSESYLNELIRVSSQETSENPAEIAVGTNSVERAMYYLGQQGVGFDMRTAEYKHGRLLTICSEDKVGGFVIRLVQK